MAHATRKRASGSSSRRSTKPAARKRTNRAKRRTAAPKSRAAYSKIKFGTRQSVTRSLAGLRLAAPDIGALLDTARGESITKANQLALGIVGQKRRVGEERTAIRGLLRWASVQTTDTDARRRIVLKAFIAQKRELFAIHGISELAPAEAAAFARSFVSEGGSLQAVGEWLAIAGKALRKTQPPVAEAIVIGTAIPSPRPARRNGANGRGRAVPRKAGIGDFFSDAADAVGDFLSDAADSVSNAVSGVVNAFLSLGLGLASIISAAVSWTVSKLGDLVRALVAAGKTVASILSEALNKGVSVLKKFVQAVVAAGRATAEVLTWAVGKATNIIKEAISALLAAGRTVYNVVVWATGAVASVAQKVVRGLLDAGRTVVQVMAEVVRLSATLAKKMVAAVYAVTQAVGSILVSIAQTAASVIRTVIEGLLAIGVTLAKTVASICTDVVAAFRRGLIEGLIALGRAPLDILKAALETSLATLALAFAVVMENCGGHRALTAAEKAEARRVFGWSIDLDRVKVAVASIPADIANWANGQRPFTTMYVINFASNAHITMSTLIHELTHVWQAVVAGPIYMVEALHSQFFGRGYEVTDADIAAANGDIKNLEREQQATVVERYYIGKWGDGSFDAATYEQLAKQVYKAQPIRVTPMDVLLPHMLPVRVVSRVPRLDLHAVT